MADDTFCQKKDKIFDQDGIYNSNLTSHFQVDYYEKENAILYNIIFGENKTKSHRESYCRLPYIF